MQNSTQLVLIVSARHSGSTLLDLLVGNHSQIASAGEMNRLTLYPSDRYCTCGETIVRCAYWEAVRRQVIAERGLAPVTGWHELPTDVPPQAPLVDLDADPRPWLVEGPLDKSLRALLEGAGIAVPAGAILEKGGGPREAKWRFEDARRREVVLRHEGGRLQVYPPLIEWKRRRNAPRLLELALAFGGRPAVTALESVSSRARGLVTAARNSWHVADALAGVTGARYVVDSSKFVVRLRLMQSLRPGTVRVIWLVRDGRAVAASAIRRQKVTAAVAARVWKDENMRLRFVSSSVPEEYRHQIKYEELCAHPARELEKVCAFLGLSFEAGMTTLWNRPVHDIPGNTMLFNRQRTTVQCDDRWRRELSSSDLATFERVAGGLNQTLGYA